MVNSAEFGEYLRMSAHGIRTRSKRSWLTMIGIFIGIAAVVSLISLGQGLQNAINDEFASLGRDTILISPGGALFGAGGVNSLSEDDYQVIDRVRGVEGTSGYAFSTGMIEWEKELWYYIVMGFPTEPARLDLLSFGGTYEVEHGRTFRIGDRYKAIIGYDYANSEAFHDKLKIGDTFSINGQEFDVIGSWKRIGNSQDDRAITIPLDTFRELYDIPTRMDSIVVKIKQDQDPAEVALRIEEAMRRDRHLKPGDEDFNVQTTEELMQSFNTILNIVTSVLIGLAAISLLVGMVGIMNTMYTAVLERTKDIGIMKAIGARNSDIRLLFLIESGLLGLAGGVIGILLGAAISSSVSYLAQTAGGFDLLRADFPLWLIAGALFFSFAVGVASGVLPAQQAASKNPVDSLRYE